MNKWISFVIVFAYYATMTATTLHVDTLLDINDSSCSDGSCSLRDAMLLADDNDIINIDVNGTIILSSHLPDIEEKTLSIIGPGKDNLTISGNNMCRPIKVYQGNLYLSNLTIEDGNNTNEPARDYPDYGESETSGGALFLSRSGSLHINNVGFSNNISRIHGGAIAAAGSLFITDATFYNNDASWGGAIRSDSYLEINTSTFTLNESSTWGGAAYIIGTSVIQKSSFVLNKSRQGGAFFFADGGSDRHEIIDTEILANIASSVEGGGGIYNASALKLERSLLSSNNSNGYGGGIYYKNGSNLGGNDSVIINSTISHNTAASKGGAIYLMNSTASDLNISHTTIVNNISESLESGGIAQNVGHLYLKNSLLSNNKMTNSENKEYARDCTTISPDHFHSNGNNLVTFKSSSNPDPCPFVASDINSSVVQVGTLTNNGGVTKTHALLETSIAHNAATCRDNNSIAVLEDQRGYQRSRVECDIGAFELNENRASPALIMYLLN